MFYYLFEEYTILFMLGELFLLFVVVLFISFAKHKHKGTHTHTHSQTQAQTNNEWTNEPIKVWPVFLYDFLFQWFSWVLLIYVFFPFFLIVSFRNCSNCAAQCSLCGSDTTKLIKLIFANKRQYLQHEKFTMKHLFILLMSSKIQKKKLHQVQQQSTTFVNEQKKNRKKIWIGFEFRFSFTSNIMWCHIDTHTRLKLIHRF